MGITLIFIAQKDKSAVVKCKLCPRQKQPLLHRQHANTKLTQSDDKAESMLTPSPRQPEPEQVAEAVMSSQGCSIVASISTCSCFYSRITVVITMKSLSAGFQRLCVHM